ncbi:MAG: hypothetical protein JXB49_01380 [Bacteroidales bacterium]|nr:hypothetical protein [Bacteroidales bacterium]
MKRISILYIILLSILISCAKTDHEKELDNLISQKIIETLSKDDQHLWSTIENEFYNKMKEFEVFDTNDTLKSLIDLNNRIQIYGYKDDFYFDTNSTIVKGIIENLDNAGYKKTDECAHRFLFSLCNPIVEQYEKENDVEFDELNLVKFFAINNPDTISVPYETSIHALNENTEYLEKNWKEPGTRKMLILMYISRMINPDWHKK